MYSQHEVEENDTLSEIQLFSYTLYSIYRKLSCEIHLYIFGIMFCLMDIVILFRVLCMEFR